MKKFLAVLLLLPMIAHALSHEDIKEWKLIEGESMKPQLYLGLPYLKNGDKVLLIENKIMSESYSPSYSGYNIIRIGHYNTNIYDCKNKTVARKHSVNMHRSYEEGETIADADLKFHEVGTSQQKIMDIVCK